MSEIHLIKRRLGKLKIKGILCRMLCRSSYFLLTALLLWSTPSVAQKRLTLSDAINKSFLSRKSMLAGRSDLTIRKLQTEALYRKYWPQVSAEYTYLYNPILQTSILPIGIFNPSYPIDATKSIQFGTKWSQTAGITVNQPLLDLSIQRSIREAKMQESITLASQAQSEYELAYTVAQQYLEVGLQESKIKSAIADTLRTYTSYDLLRNKYDEKRLLKSELNKSLINHHNSLQKLRDANSEFIEVKVNLLTLMGETDLAKSDFATDSTVFNPGKLTGSAPSSISEQLPELQQLELQGLLTNLQVRSEKAKHLPTIGIKGFIGANQYTNNFDPTESNTWFGVSYVGLDCKFPLLSGENAHKKIVELRLQTTQYKQQMEDKSALYARDTFTATLKMRRVASQLKTQEENLALSIESIGITQARFFEGQESASTLNLDEASLQQLENEYELNKKQVWVYWLDHLKSSGRLYTLWK